MAPSLLIKGLYVSILSPTKNLMPEMFSTTPPPCFGLLDESTHFIASTPGQEFQIRLRAVPPFDFEHVQCDALSFKIEVDGELVKTILLRRVDFEKYGRRFKKDVIGPSKKGADGKLVVFPMAFTERAGREVGEIVVTIHRRADGEAVSPKESTFDKDFTGVKLGTAIAEPAAQASTFYNCELVEDHPLAIFTFRYASLAVLHRLNVRIPPQLREPSASSLTQPASTTTTTITTPRKSTTTAQLDMRTAQKSPGAGLTPLMSGLATTTPPIVRTPQMTSASGSAAFVTPRKERADTPQRATAMATPTPRKVLFEGPSPRTLNKFREGELEDIECVDLTGD